MVSNECQALLGRQVENRDEEKGGYHIPISDSPGRNYHSYTSPVRKPSNSPTKKQIATLLTHPEKDAAHENGILYRTPSDSSRSLMTQFRHAKLDRDALHFGVRMSVCITMACLFVLLRKPGEELHQAVWIVVTVQFVCWFPDLDAASVVEKSIQRLYGTFVGATSGLTCGFLSLAILNIGVRQDEDGDAENKPNVMAQSTFLIFCVATYTFLNCFVAVQFRVGKSKAKIISKYNYACILSLLTFYICVLPFYCDEDPKWENGMYRVLNVIVGCVLGATLSVTVLPRSTASIIRERMERQIELAGEAAQAVLHMAADCFSENVYVGPEDFESEIREKISLSRRPWRKQDHEASDALLLSNDDLTLTKYESAIAQWRTIKAQLSNLRYDPFNIGTPDILLCSFQSEINNTLARSLRIQNTVLLIDGIVRNDPKHDFSATQIQLVADTGSLIHSMLSREIHKEKREVAFEKLVVKLGQIRQSIIALSSVVARSSTEMPPEAVGALGVCIIGSKLDLAGMDDAGQHPMVFPDISRSLSMESLQYHDDQQGRGLPKFVHGSRVCTLLFLQLVEHLALRSVRLYQSWHGCEAICDACEKRYD